MSERLKIYACSGFEAKNDFKYLMLESKRTVDNTQVVNMMLNNINLARTEVAYLDLTKDQVRERLNFIDLCALIVNIAERYADNEKELYAAGEVVTFMLNKGLFQIESTDENERAEHLDKLFSVFDELIAEGVTVSKKEMGWWNEEVMQRAKVGLDSKQRKLVKEALGTKKAAVSGNAIDDLAEHIDKAGTYFLYRYFTDEQLKQLPKYFKQKAIGQQRLFEYDLPLFDATYGGGRQAFEQAIRASIIKQWKGSTPEEVCADIVAGRRKEDGSVSGGAVTLVWTVEAIIKLLQVILPLLVVLILGIVKAAASVSIEKNKAVTEEEINAFAPQDGDYTDRRYSNQTKTAGLSTNTLLLAVGAALAYTIIADN